MLHKRDVVSAAADPESHILQVAASRDVVGRIAANPLDNINVILFNRFVFRWSRRA